MRFLLFFIVFPFRERILFDELPDTEWAERDRTSGDEVSPSALVLLRLQIASRCTYGRAERRSSCRYARRGLTTLCADAELLPSFRQVPPDTFDISDARYSRRDLDQCVLRLVHSLGVWWEMIYSLHFLDTCCGSCYLQRGNFHGSVRDFLEF